MDAPGEPVVNEEQPMPVNETPSIFIEGYHFVVSSLQAYGWFIVLGIVILMFLKSKLEPHYNKWRKRQEVQNEYSRYSADEVERRQNAMAASRQRMQEKLDAQAAKYAEEQKQKEEEKRKMKIEDWENHKEGKGYRSKYKPTEQPSSSSSASASSKAKPKSSKPFRQSDYNPLTGASSSASSDGASCAWRPGRRGGNTGGG